MGHRPDLAQGPWLSNACSKGSWGTEVLVQSEGWAAEAGSPAREL